MSAESARARSQRYREAYLAERNSLDRNPAIDADDLSVCPEGLPQVTDEWAREQDPRLKGK